MTALPVIKRPVGGRGYGQSVAHAAPARDDVSMSRPRPGLSVWQGAALYVGAVLGTGVIALPSLAAKTAGPASLVAWAGMVLLSVPLAGTFAALGARYPDAGGVSTYVRLAFGARPAGVVGWCFYFGVPIGASPAALFAGQYVAAAAGGGRRTEALTAVALMTVVPAANAFGVRISARLQLGLTVLLLALLMTAVATSAPHARAANLHPFAPHGLAAIFPAAALLMWSFAGWEAITHLAAEFRSPARDIPRATAIAVVVIGVIYLAVASLTVLVLGPNAGRTGAPLAELLRRGVGGPVQVITAVAAVLLTAGTMNAYYAGVAKLGAALGRDGALPRWLGAGSSTGEIPRRSLLVVSTLALAMFGGVEIASVDPRPLVLMMTSCLVTVYLLGTAAAVRLMPPRSGYRRISAVAFVAVLGLLIATGVYLAWAAVVTIAALLYLRWHPPPAQAQS